MGRSVRLWLVSVRQIGKTFFSSRYLLYTNTGLSVALSVVGDLFQQKYQSVRSSSDKSLVWNKKRTGQMATAGFVIGPFVHYWYIYLDKWLPGRGVKTLVKKVALDQMICSPVYVSLFLVSTGCLDGGNWTSLKDDFKDKGVKMFISECVVWPPAQFVNFYFLPTHFRVMFDNIVSLCMDAYFSYLRYDYTTHSKLD